jgi:hypothetical protein
MVLWAFGPLTPTDSDPGESKTEIKEDKANEKIDDRTSNDLGLHLLPFVSLLFEYAVNCQPFLFHHYKIVILGLFFIPHLVVTVLLEFFTG